MDNNTLQIKLKLRLNKLASLDYDNLECWQIAEAVNKAQIEWVRRQVHGTNQRKEGDESTKVLIDDLQNLLVPLPMLGQTIDKLYYETVVVPTDYLYYKRIDIKAGSDCCDPKRMRVYLDEVADATVLLADEFKKPSLEWGETFATMQGNKFRIYHDDKFTVSDAVLTYYRKPTPIAFANCVDTVTGAATVDSPCEFKDDVVELIIDEAAAILAGDMELFNQYQRNKQNSTTNT